MVDAELDHEIRVEVGDESTGELDLDPDLGNDVVGRVEQADQRRVGHAAARGRHQALREAPPRRRSLKREI